MYLTLLYVYHILNTLHENPKNPIWKDKGYISNIKYRRQHDYINYYYEHREKFEKKYLNKNKGIKEQKCKWDQIIYKECDRQLKKTDIRCPHYNGKKITETLSNVLNIILNLVKQI